MIGTSSMSGTSTIASEIQRQPNTRRIRSKHHIATVLGAASRQNPGVQNDTGIFTAPAALEHTGTMQQPVDTSSMEDIQMTTPQNFPPSQAQYVSAFVPLHHQKSTSQQQLSWSRPRKAKKCAICKKEDCPGRGNRSLCVTAMEVSFLH